MSGRCASRDWQNVVLHAICSFALISASEQSPFIALFDVKSEPSLTANETAVYPQPLPCRYFPGYTVGNRSRELQCCDSLSEVYKGRWVSVGSLNVFLEALRGWRCPQLSQECASPTFAFTQHNKLMYLRFCNQSQLLEQCEEKLMRLAKSKTKDFQTHGGDNSSLLQWKSLVSKVNFTDVNDFSDPCLQVATYDSQAGGYGNYQQILSTHVPFCSISTCGYDVTSLQRTHASAWTCISSTCRANIVVLMVFLGILSLSVILSNVTVLYVILTSRKLRNSQAVYKVSLAVADLIAGLVVIPTFAVSLSLSTAYTQSPVKYEDIQGYNVNLTEEGNILKAVALKSRGVAGTSQNLVRYTYSYIVMVGFFTALSFMVSVYTLMLASIDRFYAVTFPMKFRKSNSTVTAVCAVLALWLSAVVIGTLPLYVKGMNYGLVASVLVSFSGSGAIYVYTVAFAFPLVVVWATTTATHCASKRHGRLRRQMTNASEFKRLRKMESRLAKTLGLMVSAFSASILPAVIVLIIPLFVTNIYLSKPKFLDPTAYAAYTSVEFVSVIILSANSLWNCFIYGLRNRDFRLAAKLGYSRLFRLTGVRRLSGRFSSFVSSRSSDRNANSSSSGGGRLNNTRVSHISPATSYRLRATRSADSNETNCSGSHVNHAAELR